MAKSRVEKIAVDFGGTRKIVRSVVEYCGSCKNFCAHVYLKPSVFSPGLDRERTTKVCVGCHRDGRYHGQAANMFTFSFFQPPGKSAVATA